MTEHLPSDERFPFIPATESTAELVVRKSRFLAFLAPCRSKEEAQSYLNVLKQTYWDAGHHCYAYRLGPDGMDYRMSDDGEPSGTAGKPLLFCLQRARLTNCILVVVRYFGGVKLGVGPLARAYADAAQVVIDQAELLQLVPMTHVDMYCSYDDMSMLIEGLQQYGCTYEVSYGDAVTFHVVMPAHEEQTITGFVVDLTNGRAGFSKVST